MRKLFVLLAFVLFAVGVFSQSDTTAIFHTADSLNELGNKFYNGKKYSEAMNLYNQAAEMTKGINEGYNDHYATSLYNIAWVYNDIRDYKTAIEYFIMTTTVIGEEEPKYANSLNKIGTVYANMGECQNALKYFTQAMEIRKKVLGEEHPNYAASLNNVGNVYDNIGDYHNALKYHTQAMEIRKKVLGE